jgi:hypothetical protein
MGNTSKLLKKDVRKAYFSGNLNKFLAKLQEEEVNPEDLEKIDKYLTEFKEEELAILNDFKEYLPKNNENKAPTVDELFQQLTPEKEAKMEEWLKNMDEMMENCIKLVREQRARISEGKSIDSKKFLDLGLFLITNKLWLDDVLVYRELLYKKKIIKIIDEYHISRREAQDRAEITREYFEYKSTKKKLDNLEEISIYAKKYQGGF